MAANKVISFIMANVINVQLIVNSVAKRIFVINVLMVLLLIKILQNANLYAQIIIQ